MEISLDRIVANKDPDEVEDLMSYAFSNDKDEKALEIVHQLISEPWHSAYEDMAHYLQHCKSPKSVPFIKNAMQKKYEYLESYGTGTRQFINQCGHALWSIGTAEAIDTIKELAKSADPIVKDEMLYRASRIAGTDDYERNDDSD
jgi:hypothetical protein